MEYLSGLAADDIYVAFAKDFGKFTWVMKTLNESSCLEESAVEWTTDDKYAVVKDDNSISIYQLN